MHWSGKTCSCIWEHDYVDLIKLNVFRQTIASAELLANRIKSSGWQFFIFSFYTRDIRLLMKQLYMQKLSSSPPTISCIYRLQTTEKISCWNSEKNNTTVQSNISHWKTCQALGKCAQCSRFKTWGQFSLRELKPFYLLCVGLQVCFLFIKYVICWCGAFSPKNIQNNLRRGYVLWIQALFRCANFFRDSFYTPDHFVDLQLH